MNHAGADAHAGRARVAIPRNTTLTAPLPPGGLPPGASLTVGLTFATDVAGTFWFAYDVDTLGLT